MDNITKKDIIILIVKKKQSSYSSVVLKIEEGKLFGMAKTSPE